MWQWLTWPAEQVHKFVLQLELLIPSDAWADFWAWQSHRIYELRKRLGIWPD